MDPIAELRCYDLGNGFLRVVGTVVEDGDVKDIDFDRLPKAMLSVMFNMARAQGALV